MANYNRVILVGNLTRDPEIRYTPSGTAVTQFGLAVNRTWRSQEGDNREEVCYIDITAWGRVGEIISEYKSKGDPILIEGRLQMESWQAQDGQKRTKHVVVVENFQFLDRGGRREGPPLEQPRQARPAPAPAPQQQPKPQDEPQGGDDAFGGDDVPF
jgi:single-strand DNA-binding protein